LEFYILPVALALMAFFCKLFCAALNFDELAHMMSSIYVSIFTFLAIMALATGHGAFERVKGSSAMKWSNHLTHQLTTVAWQHSRVHSSDRRSYQARDIAHIASLYSGTFHTSRLLSCCAVVHNTALRCIVYRGTGMKSLCSHSHSHMSRVNEIPTIPLARDL
jgi:hypothetical protein